jgi:hypothetical protein
VFSVRRITVWLPSWLSGFISVRADSFLDRCGDDTFRIKSRSILKHVIDRTRDLVRQDRVALELPAFGNELHHPTSPTSFLPYESKAPRPHPHATSQACFPSQTAQHRQWPWSFSHIDRAGECARRVASKAALSGQRSRRRRESRLTGVPFMVQ